MRSEVTLEQLLLVLRVVLDNQVRVEEDSQPQVLLDIRQFAEEGILAVLVVELDCKLFRLYFALLP